MEDMRQVRIKHQKEENSLGREWKRKISKFQNKYVELLRANSSYISLTMLLDKSSHEDYVFLMAKLVGLFYFFSEK